MTTNFIVRFDDICSEMNWIVWDRIENILDKYQIKPIVAIVPFNLDPFLKISAPKADFWQRAKDWQEKGWAIGLHGFTHVYETCNSGIVGLNSRSEFAGLSITEQREKINSAVKIFSDNKLIIDAWVAPAHSFDNNTIAALGERGINVVSDGYFRRVVNINGVTWVPQQLWRFKSMDSGIWTVCYHHNDWSDFEIEKFENDIKLFKNQIITLHQAISNGKGGVINIWDRMQAFIWLKKITFLRILQASMIGRSLINPFMRLVRKKFY